GKNSKESRLAAANRREELDNSYRESLTRVFNAACGSSELVGAATGILIFPRLISDGFLEPGQHGQGELRINGVVHSHYRATTRPAGLPIGMRSRAIVFLFMTQEALNRFIAGRGWAAGVDNAVAVMAIDEAGVMNAEAARAPLIAFWMSDNDLMISASLQGTTVSRVDPPDPGARQ
ncbi:hypothetical protein VLK31_35875, partial [Variovorax sp. H27-G14]|uniref:lipid-binding SYLF domain-containing protein n=1 Tax=Variovorax sp. H27-G14 TaxID=3111914 RepID=UPI0038FC22FD